MFAATAFSWVKYYEFSTKGSYAEEDDIFLPPLVSNFSSYYYNKDTWLVVGIILAVVSLVLTLVLIFLINRIKIAIELIEEASKAVGEMPSMLFFPIVPFLAQLLVIIWFMVVGMFLATSGEKEYKVVGMTSTDTFCTNPDTSELYQNNEQCEPESFAAGCPQSSCTGDACPQCVFHKYGPSMAESWLQVSSDDIFRGVARYFFVRSILMMASFHTFASEV